MSSPKEGIESKYAYKNELDNHIASPKEGIERRSIYLYCSAAASPSPKEGIERIIRFVSEKI